MDTMGHPFRFEESGVILFLFPSVCNIVEGAGCVSNELTGRLEIGGALLAMWDDRAFCGRCDCADGGRVVEPTLLEYELLETLRIEEEDCGRVDTLEEKEFCREIPAIEVGLTVALTGRVPGGPGAGLEVSPARSASVFLFSVPGGGGSILGVRTLLAEADSSASFPGESIRLG